MIQAINFSVSLASPSCLGYHTTFYGRFAASVGLTAILIFGPWLTLLRHVRATADRWKRAVADRIRVSVLFTLLLHPSISGQAFFFFRCRSIQYTNQEDPVYYHVADFSLKCYEGQWLGMLLLALVVVIFFSVGIPVLLVVILWRRRHKLHEDATYRLLGM